MAACEYTSICGRNALDGHDGRCILHSEEIGKDENAFDEALKKHWEEHGPDFRRMMFPKEAHFETVTFEEKADFLGATFRRNTSFEAATFQSESCFKKTEFQGHVCFKNADFEDDASFEKVYTRLDADFNRTTFLGRALFENAVFGSVEFDESVFEGEADFKNATFRTNTDVRDVTFQSDALFRGVDFKGPLRFYKSDFEGSSDFIAATCFHEAGFRNVTFYARSLWGKAEFKESAHFNSSSFEAGVFFLDSIFQKDAYFAGAKFKGKTGFRRVTFEGSVYIQEAKFQGIVSFRNATFRRHVLLSGESESSRLFEDAKVIFTSVTYNPNDPPLFRYVDLSECHLVRTEVQEMDFTGIQWCKAVSNDEWFERNGLYDEIASMPGEILEQQSRSDTFPRAWWKSEDWNGEPHSEVERLYRQLKKNHEERGDFSRAGDFHIGEKEARRLNPKTSWGVWVLLNLYRTLSKYGERATPAFMWLVGFILVSAVGYYFLLDVPPYDPHGTITLLGALRLSLSATFFPLRPLGLHDNVVWMLNLFQRLFSPLLLALLALAIRQRVKR